MWDEYQVDLIIYLLWIDWSLGLNFWMVMFLIEAQ